LQTGNIVGRDFWTGIETRQSVSTHRDGQNTDLPKGCVTRLAMEVIGGSLNEQSKDGIGSCYITGLCES